MRSASIGGALRAVLMISIVSGRRAR